MVETEEKHGRNISQVG